MAQALEALRMAQLAARMAPREGATPDKGERRALRRLASFSSPKDVEDLEAGED